MAQDTARLEEALRNADAQGDTAAAQRFAQEIRTRRASGDQQAPAVQPLAPAGPAVPSLEDDPLAAIPIAISGVTLTPDIRQALLEGQSITDPKEKELAKARITGRIAALDRSGGIIDQLTKSEFGAGLRGFGAGLFGAGDIAAAAGTFAASGFGIGDDSPSFGDSLEIQREFRRALEEEFPLSSGVGEITGAVSTGIAGAGRLAAVKGVGLIPKLIRGATTFKKGQKSRNVLKATGLGAVGGGITEGLTEGDVVGGAKTGAAFGVLGLGAGKVINITAEQIKKKLAGPGAAGIKAIAKKLDETPEDLMRSFEEFFQISGKKPSIAEIMNPQARAEVRDIIAARASGAAIAEEAGETLARQRTREAAELVRGGKVVTTTGAREIRRGKVADTQFAAAAGDPITFSGREVDELLNDPNLRASLPGSLRRRLDDAQQGLELGEPLTLTGLDVSDLRLALRAKARGKEGADLVFGELADEVEEIGRDQSKAFGDAIDEFRGRSLQAEGITTGRKVLSQKTSEFQQAVREAGDVSAKTGVRTGVRSELADVAGEGPSQGRKLFQRLSEDTGLKQRLEAVLPADQVRRLEGIGRIRTRSAGGIADIAPGVRAEGNKELRDIVTSAVNTAVAAAPGIGTASKVFAVGRLVNFIKRLTGLPERVVNNMARDVLDPNKTEKVLAALRRANVDEADIVELFFAPDALVAASAAEGLGRIINAEQ